MTFGPLPEIKFFPDAKELCVLVVMLVLALWKVVDLILWAFA